MDVMAFCRRPPLTQSSGASRHNFLVRAVLLACCRNQDFYCIITTAQPQELFIMSCLELDFVGLSDLVFSAALCVHVRLLPATPISPYSEPNLSAV